MQINPREKGVFNTLDNALIYLERELKTDKSVHITFYDIDYRRVKKLVEEVYKHLQEQNKGKQLDEQLVPTTGYWYNAIRGCLGVECCEISISRYKHCKNGIPFIWRYNTSVLYK